MQGWVGLLLVAPAVIKAALHALGLSEDCSGEITNAVIAAGATLGLPVLATAKPIAKKKVD